MRLRIRVELPDRPGSLARVTQALGVVGADVTQIAVLDREPGRALDDVTVEWPSMARRRIAEALEMIPGVVVVGVWAAPAVAEAFPEVDLVAQLVRNPARAVATLADAVPALLAADWACVTDASGRVLLASPLAPPDPDLPGGVPGRALPLGAGRRGVRLPLPGGEHVLTVVREEGPDLHRIESQLLEQLVSVLEALDSAPAAGQDALTVP